MSIPHHSTHAPALLELYSQGVTPLEIAKTLGITASAVTQLMDSPDLAPQIQAIRDAQLLRSSQLDVKYDKLEEKLLDRLESVSALLLKPEQIMNVLEKINRAKRRGIAFTENKAPAQVVHLHLPQQMIQRVTVNTKNQVVSVGGQQLITMQSSNIPKLAEASNARTPQHPQLTQQTPQSEFEIETEFGFPIPVAR